MKIDTHFFHAKTVLVFGFGSNGGGSGTVEFLLSTKAKKIIITDKRPEADFQPLLQKFPHDPRLQYSFGGHGESDFLEADIIIKNPVIMWDHPLLIKAKNNGAEVVLDSTLFMALCQAPVLGVTGSKGKTSAAALLSHILITAGHPVVTVGVSQTGVLSELSQITNDSVVVFELSSWRLSGLRLIEKSPQVSVITNLYPDHLNYYDSMEAYASDKKVITQFQKSGDTLVVPGESEWSDFFVRSSQANIKKFGTQKGQDGWQDDRALYLKSEGGDIEILEKEKSMFRGEYIFNNFLAASLAAQSFGVSMQNIIEALKTFSGIPHRAELVREHKGIRYVNDTTATIPAAALASFQSVGTPVILLAGGSDKGLPLDDLITALVQSRYAILFQGTGTNTLVPLLEAKNIHHYEIVTSMAEAVSRASAKAMPGDTVLLAPGAASFGMFINEFDRAEQFIKGVNAL